jgi:L-2-hydroxyglutarate oxidase
VLVRSGDVERVYDRLVICAGLHADRVARLAGENDDPRIIPFRGEYYRVRPERSHLVRGLIYPVPDPRYPFLGIHWTRRIDGSLEIGPNAVLALALEGYRRRDMSMRDLRAILGWRGFRRMARANWRTGRAELWGSLSKRSFVQRARAYVPELTVRDVERGGAGVRAQAIDASGALVDDFVINERNVVFALRNAPSPGATSALAIAEHLCDQMHAR